MIQATKLVINLSSGQVEPIGPGQFIEKCVPRVINAPIQVSYDDEIPIEMIEMGSMLDEDSLKFRKKVLKLKEIFDVELLTEAAEHRQYRDAAITHFGIQELQKFAKKMKPSIKEIEGDLTLQDLDDLAIEFMREGGTDGKLVLLKNSVIICDPSDFVVHLSEVNKLHKKSRMMCGVLFAPRPYRIVKAAFTGKVRFK